MDIFNFLTMLGGLALFLYGMNVMGDGLTRASGGRLEKILEKLTSSTIRGVLLGAAVTAVIQSSSATTVMVVGFVNSGIMTLQRAVGIIMGANIGTTITSWILSLSGLQGDSFWIKMLKPSSFSPILAIIGICLLLFSKKDKKKDAGSIMIGFAVLMFGMETMSGAVKPLADAPEFTNILLMFAESGSRYAGRRTADSHYSELVGIGWYSAGTVCDRSGLLRCGAPDYYGTEYRYVCDSAHFRDRSKEKCEAYRICTSVF